MGLICSRIGCREKASASLQFDAERSSAILIDLTHARNGMPLCERHASSRTAPVGWQMVDRRTGARKVEIWSDDEAALDSAFAAPTERPTTKRPSTAAAAVVAEAPKAPSPTAAPSAAPAERPAARRDDPAPAPKKKKASKPAAEEKADDSEPGFSWPRQAEERENDEGEPKRDLAADSPLLSRAFRAAK